MYQKILVPLDGSKPAEAVLPYAGYLAGALQLPVELLHVNDPETHAPSLHPTRSADYLNRTAASCLSGLAVSCTVKSGAAAAAIVDAAAAHAGTLVAIATHGQSGGGRWLLGQVAQKVVQAANTPVLLIRPQSTKLSDSAIGLENIIVPLDGSRLAEQVSPHVVYLATRLELPVTLIRSYSLPSASYFLAAHVAPPDMAELRDKTRKETTDYLQAKAGALSAGGVKKINTVVEEGRGAEAIIELAQKTPATIVVMSTHGRSGMSRWAMGSVSDRVASHCGVPVLVIRAEP